MSAGRRQGIPCLNPMPNLRAVAATTTPNCFIFGVAVERVGERKGGESGRWRGGEEGGKERRKYRNDYKSNIYSLFVGCAQVAVYKEGGAEIGGRKRGKGRGESGKGEEREREREGERERERERRRERRVEKTKKSENEFWRDFSMFCHYNFTLFFCVDFLFI